MTKEQRDNPKEQAANFNWAMVDLCNLPDGVSFRIKKLSAKTLIQDCREEHLKEFLFFNGYINSHDFVLIDTLKRPIFGVKITKQNRFYYAFDLCSATRAALDAYEKGIKDKVKYSSFSDKESEDNNLDIDKERTERITRVHTLEDFMVFKRKS